MSISNLKFSEALELYLELREQGEPVIPAYDPMGTVPRTSFIDALLEQREYYNKVNQVMHHMDELVNGVKL